LAFWRNPPPLLGFFPVALTLAFFKSFDIYVVSIYGTFTVSPNVPPCNISGITYCI
jgi:hypothetical protein